MADHVPRIDKYQVLCTSIWLIRVPAAQSLLLRLEWASGTEPTRETKELMRSMELFDQLPVHSN
jgi:hypothetical protein